MESFGCPDFISIASSREEQPSSSYIHGYSREFQAMLESLEQEDNSEDGGQRKRRLSVDQVKALESHFEVENKLEPERKLRIAAELALEPRQVTIWFQNRRARWKTKQLERKYSVLKLNYDALKLDYDVLEKENASLASKLRELRAKLCTVGGGENNSSISALKNSEETEIKIQRNLMAGSSESDSNGFVNEPRDANSFVSAINVYFSGKVYENQTTEEPSLFITEEACNFCSVDQAPSLHW